MTDTLLSYAIVHDPDPLLIGGKASFTLAVSNPSRRYITCTSIAVTLPVGTNARDLIADAGSIQYGNYDGWTVTPQGGTINLIPSGGSATIGPDGIAFTFSNVEINDQPGTATISIAETAAADKGAAQLGNALLPVAKFPDSFHLSELLVQPVAVAAGGTVLLVWTGFDEPGCTYTIDYQPGDDVGTAVSKQVAAIGPLTSEPLTRRGGVTFTLTATIQLPGDDTPLVIQRQATATVATLSIDVQAMPPAVPVGGLVLLKWRAANAKSCMLEDGTTVDAVGEKYYCVRRDATFVVRAFDAAGNMIDGSAYVNIDPGIVATETGLNLTGAAGTAGRDGHSYQASSGDTGGPGGPVSATTTQPALDPVGRQRVILLTVVGGAGGKGGDGVFSPMPGGGTGTPGNGGPGGSASLDLTLDSSAGASAQYILDVRGGAGGAGGYTALGESQYGNPGAPGSAAISLNGQPLTVIQ